MHRPIPFTQKHDDLLNEHSQMHKEHSQMLKEHSQMLKDQSQVLNDHSRMHREHSQAIGNLQDQVHVLGLRFEDQRDTLQTVLEVVTNINDKIDVLNAKQARFDDHETRIRALETHPKLRD